MTYSVVADVSSAEELRTDLQYGTMGTRFRAYANLALWKLRDPSIDIERSYGSSTYRAVEYWRSRTFETLAVAALTTRKDSLVAFENLRRFNTLEEQALLLALLVCGPPNIEKDRYHKRGVMTVFAKDPGLRETFFRCHAIIRQCVTLASDYLGNARVLNDAESTVPETCQSISPISMCSSADEPYVPESFFYMCSITVPDENAEFTGPSALLSRRIEKYGFGRAPTISETKL